MQKANGGLVLESERDAANNSDDAHLLWKYKGKTILAVGAHPDDVELGMGGTLARLSGVGARVVVAVISIPGNLRSRCEEAREAAKILGAEVLFSIPNKCCRVEDLKRHQLVGITDGLIQKLMPAAVFTHSLANLHADHRLVYDACMASQRLRYFDLFCYPPTSCHVINIPFYPQVYVDISKTIEIKMQAIQAHSSQFHDRGLSTDYYRKLSSQVGRMVGVNYAEGLQIVRMRFN